MTGRPQAFQVTKDQLGNSFVSAGQCEERRSYSPVAAWGSVAILLLFSLLSVIDRQIIALLVEPIKADLGMSDTQLGLLQGIAFALFYSVAGIPIGWAIDRFSRRTITYLGITFWSLSAASCGLANNFWQLFAGRTMVGVGEASLTPAAVSLISDLFPRDKVATPLGVYAAGFYIGSGVALAVGGMIVGMFVGQPVVRLPIIGEVAPWQAVFIVTGLPGIVLALLAFLLSDPRPTLPASIAGKTEAEGFAAFFAGHARLIAYTFAGFGCAAFVAYAIGAWTPAYLSRTFGLRPEEIGWTWGLVVSLSGAFGAFGGGLLIDRVYRAGVRDACLVVPAIASLLSWPFLAGAYFLPSPTLVLISLGVGMALFSIIASASYTTWQQIAPPRFRGRISASFALVAGLFGAGIGPVAVALVTDHVLHSEALVGTSVSIVVSIALPVLAALLFSGRRLMRGLST